MQQIVSSLLVNQAYSAKCPKNMESSLDPDVFVWFSSQSDLNLVDLVDMSMLRIRGFLPQSKNLEKSVPFLAATADHAKYIIVIFSLMNNLAVAYQNPRITEPTDYLMVDLAPDSRLNLLSVIGVLLGLDPQSQRYSLI